MPAPSWWVWLLGWYAVASVVTIIAYGLDKRAATTGRWRTREKTLHTLALLGGWPGALVAQRAFHHKTRKAGFQVITWLVVLLHGAAWTFVLWRTVR